MKKVNLFKAVITTIANSEISVLKDLAFRYNLSERQVSEIVRDYNKLNEENKIISVDEGYKLTNKSDVSSVLASLPESKINEHLKICVMLIMKSFKEEVSIGYSIKFEGYTYYMSTIDSTLEYMGLETIEKILKYDTRSKKFIANIILHFFTRFKRNENYDMYFNKEVWDVDDQLNLDDALNGSHVFATQTIEKLGKYNKDTYSYHILFKYYLIEMILNDFKAKGKKCILIQGVECLIPTNFDIDILESLFILELEYINIDIHDNIETDHVCDEFERVYNSLNFRPKAGYLSPESHRLIDKIFFFYPKFMHRVNLEKDNYVFLKLCSLFGAELVLKSDEKTKIYKIELIEENEKSKYTTLYTNKFSNKSINILKCNQNKVYNDEHKNLYIKYKDDNSLRYINTILRFKNTKIIDLKYGVINILVQMPRSNYVVTMKRLSLNYPFVKFNFYGDYSILTNVKINYSLDPMDKYKYLGTKDKNDNYINI